VVSKLKFFVPLVLLLLAACAQQLRLETQTPRPARETIARYSLEGRVVVKRGNQSQQAGIVWQHSPDRDVLELSGPLGQKAGRLTRDVNGARLETASRETVTAADWDGLAERMLGVALPLDEMARWTIASFGKSAVIERDKLGRPQHATENGWQIDYRGYESESPEALPILIELRRDDISARLKVDQWQIGQLN
jgi:outer membrane lipoprotein LolB